MRENKWIESIGHVKGKKDRKIINVYVNKQSIGKVGWDTRPLTVPINAPEIDPYDTSTGKGFMTPNEILKSGLSSTAKLLFIALRSFICYGLGVVFPTEPQLRERMSRDIKSIRTAIKELEDCRVIQTDKIFRVRSVKKYYFLLPENQWKLPAPGRYAQKLDEIEDEIVDIETVWDSSQTALNTGTVPGHLVS